MIMNSLKTLTAAAAFATVGFAAQAATVAEITASGEYGVATDGASTELFVSGNFTAFADTAFDTSATNDFLFELDLEATGIPTIDEELLVEDITGDDIIGFALSILIDIDNALPGVLGAIIDEVTDGDLDPTNIAGVLFGFDFNITDFSGNSAAGTFAATIADGAFNTIPTTVAVGTFDGSATISTVSAVPLPATLPLLAFGGAGLMALGRRRKS